MRTYPSFADVALATIPVPLDVKMFVHQDPHEAEASVAAWLQQNPVSIQHISQSQSERNGNFVFVLTLFYQKAEQEF